MLLYTVRGVGGKGVGVGLMVTKAKTKKQDDTNGEWPYVVSTCIHNGQIIHHKA